MFVVLLPQLVSWNLLFGSPAPPPRARGYLLTAPFILQTLISTRHGLITWAPITILSFVGLLLLVVRRFKAGFPLLIGVVGLVYINGIAIDWWGGDAFGARRYVGLTSLLAFALAYLFSLPKTKVLQALMVAISLLCVSWTMLFLVQYSAGLIPHRMITLVLIN